MSLIPITHRVHHRNIPQTCPVGVPLPPRRVEVELTINVDLLCYNPETGLYTTCPTNPFPSQQTCCFGLNILQDCLLFHNVISPVFIRLGVNIFSLSYYNVLIGIMRRGLEVADEASTGGYNCRVLYLSCEIQALAMESEPEINWETSMLEESTLEFERTNYGMVAAKESSIEEMLKRARVVGGDEQNCMICLEKVELGSRMPCSHTFHADCIERWLKQSHYCPICRFEMPTN